MPRTRNGKPVEPAEPKKPRRRASSRKPKDKPEATPSEARLSMVARVRLAERIVVARAKRPRPDTWEQISKREGVAARKLQRILAQYQEEMAKLGDATGTKVLNETLLLYGESIETLAWLAEFGETGAIRVGAVRGLLEALKDRVELLAVMGRMPRSFRAVDELAMLSLLVRRMAEIVEQRGIEPDVVQEFLGLIDEVQPVIEGRATVADTPALRRAS